tara:strand:- start:468 stop:665 length:198 start_codon:yes stop_codon:yes gene_type:complete
VAIRRPLLNIDGGPMGWVKRLETSTHWPRIAGLIRLAGDRGPWAALFNYWTPRKQKARSMAGQSF